MQFSTIHFVWRKNAHKLTPVAFRRAEKLITKLEATGAGPLHCYRGNPEAAATMLSRNPAIESVIVTHVTETHGGVWRRGRKS